jgi:ATP-dependent RNA helicase DDX18/HAS1
LCAQTGLDHSVLLPGCCVVSALIYVLMFRRASRGIDFANVNHVVLFDYPRDPSEYVRRVGRTARGASGNGKAFVFAVGKQVSLARRVMERNMKGHPLHDVPCL